MIRALILSALMATPVGAANFEFCWEGDNGYRMEGFMQVPDALLNQSLITHDDVTGFFIQGFKDDVPLGAWDLRQLTPTTSWNLVFQFLRREPSILTVAASPCWADCPDLAVQQANNPTESKKSNQ